MRSHDHGRPRWRWRELLLASATAALTLLAAETALWLATPPREFPYEYDALLGWRHKVHFRGRFRGAGFDTSVVTNARRMRESEEVPETSAFFRIAVLGDSFVWGHGVEEPERFTELLEERLGSGIEVLNFGVGGYGADQERLQLERDVLPLEPDVVLVVFFLNDLADVRRDASHVGVPKPRFAIDGDGLRLVGTPVRRVAGWDRPPRRPPFGSEIPVRLRDAAALIREAAGWQPRGGPLNREHLDLLGRDPAHAAAAAGAMDIHGRLCAEMRRISAERGSALVLTEVPFREYFAAARDLEAAAGGDQAAYDLERPRRHLRAVADALGIPYVDPYPDFVAGGGMENYHAADQHLNARGHALMAALLARELRALDVVPVRDAGGEPVSPPRARRRVE